MDAFQFELHHTEDSFGLDRLVAILGQETIRDFIAFPK
jgi:aspartyl-tRNA synthetase